MMLRCMLDSIIYTYLSLANLVLICQKIIKSSLANYFCLWHLIRGCIDDDSVYSFTLRNSPLMCTGLLVALFVLFKSGGGVVLHEL